MILEDSPESIQAAKALLGIPADQRIGFYKTVSGALRPFLEWNDRRWYVGDEVLPA